MYVHLLSVMPLFLLDLVTALSLPAFVAFDEFCQVARLLGHTNKFVLEKFSGSWALM